MTTRPAAFFEPISDNEFYATTATASPWDSSLQHGGPPAALLARAIEQARPDDTMQIARISVDMLGGIPQGRVRTEATITRPGKRVEMIEARLFVDDSLVVRGTAWRIRAQQGLTTGLDSPDDLPPIPPEPEHVWFFDGADPDWGYGHATDWRFTQGGYESTGPIQAWARLRIPLVEGEVTSPIQRLLVIADSTNGISARLPMSEWLSIPPTLNVTIQHPPTTEWMLLDAHTTIGHHAIGTALGKIRDANGPCAYIAQPLLVTPRN